MNHDNQEEQALLLRPSYATSKFLLCHELGNFRVSLKWCALDHSSCLGKSISYSIFIFFTLIVPIITSVFVQLPSSASLDDPISFKLLVQFPESGLALIAFCTLSRFFRRYGLRQLLFLDGLQDDSLFVTRRYSRELDKAFRYLACILLPSFFLQLAHKIIYFSTVKVKLPGISSSGVPMNSIMFVLVLGSWAYRTGVLLLVCVLFRLTCELQILRFEGLHKLLEGCESDVGIIFREHIRIRKQLSATSHRYRIFIISCLVTITISQLGALLLVLAFKSDKNFFNSGDLVICSVVQISGFFLCLLGAARITHRAQGIVSIATRWHMMVTSASHQGKCVVPETHDADSSDIFISQDPSSFQTRQAFVAYLQHNHGGITLFGFPLDRGLLHTLFAFEFSLVLWILSKVIVLS
ncbi:uncharacterized protein LOC126667186 [Mercurialis annua]|uniref:uncharacterized protein LOC126667186 n=1 Tax=Mercurialis annua TaxID=3986 RepID=UPI00215E3CB4|nr:uncharacterized protein LOC126667186 [Mercurialis annua]XP_050216103.1 uncharacterized protein LOC126667186 [Mercurialis annua]XP_050216104.1 uncharacterized protein LOC126667186 [Mercurialis annua]